MKVIKKAFETVNREDAHGGSGGRRLYVGDNEVSGVQGMTYGYLPGGSMFSWHNHSDMNEIMLVLKGTGIVRDDDGEYPYKPGDLFIYPSDTFHEIINPEDYEHEYVFIRVYKRS